MPAAKPERHAVVLTRPACPARRSPRWRRRPPRLCRPWCGPRWAATPSLWPCLWRVSWCRGAPRSCCSPAAAAEAGSRQRCFAASEVGRTQLRPLPPPPSLCSRGQRVLGIWRGCAAHCAAVHRAAAVAHNGGLPVYGAECDPRISGETPGGGGAVVPLISARSSTPLCPLRNMLAGVCAFGVRLCGFENHAEPLDGVSREAEPKAQRHRSTAGVLRQAWAMPFTRQPPTAPGRLPPVAWRCLHASAQPLPLLRTQAGVRRRPAAIAQTLWLPLGVCGGHGGRGGVPAVHGGADGPRR